MFDDGFDDLGAGNAKTRCYNTIYEQYGTSADIVHADCTGNACKLTCRNNGQPPVHIWPDGTQSERSKFICRGKTFWTPARGTVGC